MKLLNQTFASIICIALFSCTMNKTVHLNSAVDGIKLQLNEEKYTLAINDFQIDSINLTTIETVNEHIVSGDTIIVTVDLITNFEVGLAYYRYEPWKAWTKPVRIDNIEQLNPDDQQFFLWKTKDNNYGAILPLSGNGFRSTIGKVNNKIAIISSMGIEKPFENAPSAILGYGNDPYKLIEVIFETAMTKMQKTSNLRKYKTYPSQFEYISYCTWNAMYDQMNEEKLVDAIDYFYKNNFPLGNLIIDDGWLSIDSTRKLDAFNADTIKFPNGLKPMIENLKNEKNIKNIGVWHSLNGYWQGINPASAMYKKYPCFSYIDQETWLLDSMPKETFYIANPMNDDGFSFFNDWYSYLESQGVNFVKVDNQLISERIAKGQVPVFEFAEKLQLSLQTAIKNHFNGAVINCMNMSNDAFYNFGSSSVARCVEDYFPYKIDETYNLEHGNAAAHVLSACYNALWFGQIVFTDYDMFQSHHPHAEYHAIARALSGGPIYISDIPGKQNFKLLDKLITYDGKILRTDQSLVPIKDCLFQVQGNELLKTFSRTGNTGMLAIFHATEAQKLKTTWTVSDIPFLKNDVSADSFVVYDMLNSKVQLVTKEQTQITALNRMEVALYWVSPLKNNITLLGLLDKYNGPAAIDSVQHSDSTLSFKVKDGGRFGIYHLAAIKDLWIDDVKTNLSKKANFIVLPLSEKKSHNIKIQLN